MLGSFGVGKTSLVRRFVYNIFDEKYLSTIGVQISHKTLNVPATEDTKLKFILWDIAHIEKFDNVIKSYFQGSHAGIIVYDVTRPQTFKRTEAFLKPYLEINPHSKLYFVGNKIDLVDKNGVDMEQFLQLTSKHKTSYLLTSAKTGENVEQLFSALGKLLIMDENSGGLF